MKTSFSPREFNSLMQCRIKQILLVSSIYDRFILEEDGRIGEQITAEYTELNLTNPPHFSHCNSGEEALELIKAGSEFDLIITLFDIGTLTPFVFADKVKKITNTPIVLLTSFSHEITRRLSRENCSSIDYIFGWQGNADLILAIIKMIEDKNNAQYDILEGGVQGVLLVEDSVKFYSAYLPKLYNIIIRQTNDFANEALNSKRVMMFKRTRPKILFARNLEEARQIYHHYEDNLLGIISDIAFPTKYCDSEVDAKAGIKLSNEVRKKDKQIPILLQSSESRTKNMATATGADFVDKNSVLLFDCLEDFIKNRMAFGDFVFSDPVKNTELCRAANLEQLQSCVERLDIETIVYYANQNMFSKWLFARGLFDVARVLRSVTPGDFEQIEYLRRYIIELIKGYRRWIGQGVVAEFDPKTYNKYITFARTSGGTLGGKARGLAFLNSLIERHELLNRWDNVIITIPRTMAVTTSYFDTFINYNSLSYIANEKMTDSEILAEFMASRLSDDLLNSIRVFIRTSKNPLAIRSSSKLEDSHYQPFAGVYSTYMVPYVENEDKMLRLVAKAIKSVYASVFYRSSRKYIEASGNILEEEKMAVVIQQICGTTNGHLFYPTFSGVARSINYYPIGDEKSNEGICNIAVGLGKGVVEGGVTMRFSPSHPKHALQLTSPEIALRDTQKLFWALDMDPDSFKISTDDGVNMRQVEIAKLEDTKDLRYVASTWNMADGRLVDNVCEAGRRVITFAPILKYDLIPLAEIIKKLLDIGQQALHSPVEIEFAVNIGKDDEKVLFNVLQIRPIAQPERECSFDWNTLNVDKAILYSEKVLGMGDFDDIRDIVYVKPEAFDPAHSQEVAQQIADINKKFVKSKKGYVLIGAGRWGSSDSWLGIPVKWSDICNSRVVVECNNARFNPDPSQGTHFFQNLTSFGVGYLTLNPAFGSGKCDFEALDSFTAKEDTKWLRHVEFSEPLRIAIDSNVNKAVILNP